MAAVRDDRGRGADAPGDDVAPDADDKAADRPTQADGAGQADATGEAEGRKSRSRG